MLPLLVLVYVFVGVVAAFIVRRGVASTRVGYAGVVALWPLLVMLMFGLVAVEMIATGGQGYEDEDEGEDAC